MSMSSSPARVAFERYSCRFAAPPHTQSGKKEGRKKEEKEKEEKEKEEKEKGEKNGGFKCFKKNKKIRHDSIGR